MGICTKVLQSPDLTLLVVQGAPCSAAAVLFEMGHTWVGRPTSLHMPFTRCWEGQMLVDGNRGMVEQLVQWQRHKQSCVRRCSASGCSGQHPQGGHAHACSTHSLLSVTPNSTATASSLLTTHTHCSGVSPAAGANGAGVEMDRPSRPFQLHGPSRSGVS